MTWAMTWMMWSELALAAYLISVVARTKTNATLRTVVGLILGMGGLLASATVLIFLGVAFAHNMELFSPFSAQASGKLVGTLVFYGGGAMGFLVPFIARDEEK